MAERHIYIYIIIFQKEILMGSCTILIRIITICINENNVFCTHENNNNNNILYNTIRDWKSFMHRPYAVRSKLQIENGFM